MATIRSYRSVIDSCHQRFEDCSSVTTSHFLSKLCKSFFLKRPPLKSLLPALSLPAVLRLSGTPFESKASLRDISLKTVFFGCYCFWSESECPLCFLLDHGHVCWEPLGVRLVPRPGYIAKNQSEASRPVDIFLSTVFYKRESVDPPYRIRLELIQARAWS